MSDWEIVAAAVVVFAVVIGFLAHWYVVAWWWWPLVGPEWRAAKWPLEPQPAPHGPNPFYPPGREGYDPQEEFCEDCQTLCTEDRPCICCYVEREERKEDDWGDELRAMNAELRHEDDERVGTGGHPIYADLSDDPDLVVWDAGQQAKRCWEIVHIEFPRLRTQLLAEYAVAA